MDIIECYGNPLKFHV